MWIHNLTKTQGKQLYKSQPKAQLQPKTQARTFIAQAVWLQLANQPTLNTPDQNNTQPHAEPELPNRIQLIFLPTRKTFPKEFGKLKRNLRQRLLCGLFNREPKGGSETKGSNFLVTEDELENENPVDMVLEGLREAVPQQLPHQS